MVMIINNMTTIVTREEFNTLNEKVASLEKANKAGKSLVPKKKKAPSKYNLYVGDKIREIKIKTPTISHKDAFKDAVHSWNLEKEKAK